MPQNDGGGTGGFGILSGTFHRLFGTGWNTWGSPRGGGGWRAFVGLLCFCFCLCLFECLSFVDTNPCLFPLGGCSFRSCSALCFSSSMARMAFLMSASTSSRLTFSTFPDLSTSLDRGGFSATRKLSGFLKCFFSSFFSRCLISGSVRSYTLLMVSSLC